jgi:tetratricopeptide (TPR) repeat protein
LTASGPLTSSPSSLAPGGALLLICLALLVAGVGRAGAAGAGRAGSVTGDDPRAVAYEEALGHYRAGRFPEALESIGRAIREFGANAALLSLSGWCRLRGGDPAKAESDFHAALVLDSSAADPHVGLGYVRLRRREPREAAREFEAALGRAPGSADALKGLGLARRDEKRFGEAADLLRRALKAAPGDVEAQALLDQVLAASGEAKETRPRPPVRAGEPLRVIAEARDGAFYVPAAGGRRRLFVKGVNMGVALPGRFPAEFPEDQALYVTWLETIASLGANAVRLYTLLPPAFYAALAEHNRKPGDGPLWLVQGVWTELPEDDDYDGRAFRGGFEDEIRRVVDAVHGNLDLPARPGHASGRYRADVSGSTLAYLLGREWEPYSVEAYEKRAAARRAPPFAGEFVTVDAGAAATPFETWLAKVLDFTVGYETTRYREQRPVSFVNWPTLDPLRHPTESTVAEEREMFRRRGEIAEAERIREYDNDKVDVDATHLRATAGDRAGLFAAYHAYPYYPDFMDLDPGYLRARDSQGPSNYIGYLRDLRRHHGAQPVLIAEVGVPSSRGVAHLQPQGMNHGGHSEREQGAIDARLMRDIDEAGLAGGILFALLDEWFKRNWLVAEFEIPSERNPLWLNALDPEQNYGILAARPGESADTVTIDGRGGDWAGDAPLLTKSGGPERAFGDGHDAARTLRSLAVASDEAYLYLRLDVGKLDADGDGSPDWDAARYVIGIDTYDARRGDHRLPVRDAARGPIGFEFCLVFDGETTSRLLVDPPYDIETHRAHRPYGSVENDDGRYMAIRVETNRRRLARDGTLFPAQWSDRSQLRHGSIDPRDRDFDTLADWHTGRDGEFIEARIPWGLLNVTDPSSRRVLHDDPNDLRSIGTLSTPGFRFQAASFKPEGAPGGETPFRGRVADRLPGGEAPVAGDFPTYAWRVWDRPTYRIEKKAGFPILQKTLRALPARGEAP